MTNKEMKKLKEKMDMCEYLFGDESTKFDYFKELRDAVKKSSTSTKDVVAKWRRMVEHEYNLMQAEMQLELGDYDEEQTIKPYLITYKERISSERIEERSVVVFAESKRAALLTCTMHSNTNANAIMFNSERVREIKPQSTECLMDVYGIIPNEN